VVVAVVGTMAAAAEVLLQMLFNMEARVVVPDGIPGDIPILRLLTLAME
jgi:hypothetical protein